MEINKTAAEISKSAVVVITIAVMVSTGATKIISIPTDSNDVRANIFAA
jgi:hypothetical protein